MQRHTKDEESKGGLSGRKATLKSTTQAPPSHTCGLLLYLCSRHKFKLTAVGKLGFYFTDTGVERDSRGAARGENRIIFILWMPEKRIKFYEPSSENIKGDGDRQTEKQKNRHELGNRKCSQLFGALSCDLSLSLFLFYTARKILFFV